jgi:hypothetical protein
VVPSLASAVLSSCECGDAGLLMLLPFDPSMHRRLYSNQISSLVSGTFTNLSSLGALWVFCFVAFSGSPSAYEVMLWHLSGNRISSVADGAFPSDLSNLVIL